MAKTNSATTEKTKKFRTPIVAVLGHVDHGKTSLLDAIRGTSVQAKEKGGITQNTRAHQITTESGHLITFIDTPGHEAFSAMRSRGAAATDFVLLVVAADDGVQPQTKESIKFAKEAGTPIIVAINKIDLPGVKPDKVKQELANFDVAIESYGGDAMCFEVSAKESTGIKDLVEGIELLAEMNELKPHEPEKDTLANAFVLESTVDQRLGPVALCILKAGALKGAEFGATADEVFKVRAYLDQNQKNTTSVKESDPFWVTGLHKALTTGDILHFCSTEKAAKEAQAAIQAKQTHAQAPAEADVDTNALLMQMLMQRKAEELGIEQKTLNVVLKSSTKGTLEAIMAQLEKLGDKEKKINILSAEPGPINNDDIKRAQAAKGIVISFQLPVPSRTEKFAKQNRVIIRNYEVIYEMLDELQTALDSLMEPPEQEVEVARARVKKVFILSDGSVIAGCDVIMGNMVKGYQVFVERPSLSTKNEVAEIGRGKISSLRILKEEVKEVKKGQECGISIIPKIDKLQEGDEIVAYKLER
jgi:translation initiation factor IF-2